MISKRRNYMRRYAEYEYERPSTPFYFDKASRHVLGKYLQNGRSYYDLFDLI